MDRDEKVYSAGRQPGGQPRFLQGLSSDLRAAPGVAWRLFLSDQHARNRQSGLGLLWLVLPTLAIASLWAYLGKVGVLTVGNTLLPYPVHVLAGTILWQVFVEALNSPLQQLSGVRDLMTKTKVPHEGILLAGLLNVAFNCAARLGVLLVFLIAFRCPMTPTALLVPAGVLALIVLGFSLGLLVTPVGLLYRDVAQMLGVLGGFWFLLTPVAYTPPARGTAGIFIELNPVNPLLETTRRWLSPGPAVPDAGFALVVAAALLGVIVGWWLYRVARPHLITRISG